MKNLSVYIQYDVLKRIMPIVSFTYILHVTNLDHYAIYEYHMIFLNFNELINVKYRQRHSYNTFSITHI